MAVNPIHMLIDALDEYLSGGLRLPVEIPSDIDVGSIRRRTGRTQEQFAELTGVTLATVRNWEQGRRKPQGPARILLSLLHRNPHVVEQTLNS